MIAAEDETVSGAAQDGLHHASVRFDTRPPGVVEAAAVDRAPEVRVELEIGHAPVAAHRAKYVFEMRLHVRMGTVEDVPRTTTPAPERHLVGAQRGPVG